MPDTVIGFEVATLDVGTSVCDAKSVTLAPRPRKPLPPGPCTCCGVLYVNPPLTPLPSSPRVACPQPHTLPSALTASACSRPAPIAMTPVRPATCTGTSCVAA